MLEICPMTLKEANAYVEQYHRHHKPVVGHKFSIGCSDGEKIVGVAIVGRPVARHLDDGLVHHLLDCFGGGLVNVNRSGIVVTDNGTPVAGKVTIPNTILKKCHH